MEAQIQKGYLVLADISGYTSFLAHNELDHAPAILHHILTLLVDALTPLFDLAEVEGDAVFVFAPAARMTRGELVLEAVESTYQAFRDRQRTMRHNATCPCKACKAIESLDLKFVVHFGTYALQDVTGTTKPIGSCVNTAHRLLKNGVQEATGWRGYALFSQESLDEMAVCPTGAHRGAEHFDHLGRIETTSIDLDARYRALIDARRVFLTPEEADVVVSHDFAAALPLVWDWLNDPHKRNTWMEGSDWRARDRPAGRTAPAAKNHCANSRFIEDILDWRPFSYYTVCYRRGLVNLLLTGVLTPLEAGTHLEWRMRLEGTMPRWMMRPLARFLTGQLMRVREGLARMDALMAGKAEPVAA